MTIMLRLGIKGSR